MPGPRRGRFRPKNAARPRFSLGVPGSPGRIASRPAAVPDVTAAGDGPSAGMDKAAAAGGPVRVRVRAEDGPRRGSAAAGSAAAAAAALPEGGRVGSQRLGPQLMALHLSTPRDGRERAALPPSARRGRLLTEWGGSPARAMALPGGLLQVRRWVLDAASVADMLAIACTLWVVLALSLPSWQAWSLEAWAGRAGAQYSPGVVAGAAHIIAPQALELCVLPAIAVLLGSLLGPTAACASWCYAEEEDADSRSESVETSW